MRNTPSSHGRRPRSGGRRRLVHIVGALMGALAVAAGTVLMSPPFRDAAERLLGRAGERTGALVIPEGWRAAQVYAAVDAALGERPGTTRRAVATAELRLPAAARGNPEGYLFPATYPIDSGTTPHGLLRYMVGTAHERFGGDRGTPGARRGAATDYRTVTIASVAQAEADTARDMGKVARVVYNRLARGMPLQMDSTLNYALNRSTLDTTIADTRIAGPYNSYARRGLPPTPIDNPGEAAVRAALDPPPGEWLYFVTVAPGDTRFSVDYPEHQRHVAEFNARRARAR